MTSLAIISSVLILNASSALADDVTPPVPPPLSASVSDAVNALAQMTPESGAPVGVPAAPPAITQEAAPAALSTAKVTRALRRGQRGDEVKALQIKLVSLGYLSADSATGFFGALTEAAVRKFQCDKSLVCQGTVVSTGYGGVGKKTRALLEI